ncbi:hypothetical protein TNCV_4006051 [Trichonephila clavipes]|nr:hypothetical protein TNCV_4006051 [Trichonephila clavipes]
MAGPLPRIPGCYRTTSQRGDAKVLLPEESSFAQGFWNVLIVAAADKATSRGMDDHTYSGLQCCQYSTIS